MRAYIAPAKSTAKTCGGTGCGDPTQRHLLADDSGQQSILGCKLETHIFAVLVCI